MPSNIVGLHQMHPPGCQCGCGGNWGCDDPNWGQDLMQCWNQINQLKCIIKQILDEVGGPVRTGPIKGVIDGSDAKPGEVGEIARADIQTGWSIADGTSQTQVVTGIVLSPGDWDVSAQLLIPFVFNGGWFMCTATNPMLYGSIFAEGPTDQQADTSMTSMTTRLSASTPTLLPFTMAIQNATGSLISGNSTLSIMARRVR